MGGQTLPEQRPQAGQVLAPGVQVGHHRVFLDRFILHAQQQIAGAAIGLTDKIGDSVQAFPVEPVAQPRRLSAGRPGFAHARFEGEATLIVEDSRGRSLSRPFLIRGHSAAIQRAMACASRAWRTTGWFLAGPAHGVEQVADRVRMIGHTEQTGNQIRDARKRPELGFLAVCLGALQKRHGQWLFLWVGQTGFRACRMHGQPVDRVGLPALVPSTHGGSADVQAAGDFGVGKPWGKQGGGFLTPLLKLFAR